VSRIVETPLGRFRAVTLDGTYTDDHHYGQHETRDGDSFPPDDR